MTIQIHGKICRNPSDMFFLELKTGLFTSSDSGTFGKYQETWLFQDMFISSCKTGREIGKKSHLTNMFDTESPSRRIACEGCKKLSMARAGQPASVTAVPLVMLQDYTWQPSTGPFQENEYMKCYQKNGCLRKSSLKPPGRRQNTCFKKHGFAPHHTALVMHHSVRDLTKSPMTSSLACASGAAVPHPEHCY